MRGMTVEEDSPYVPYRQATIYPDNRTLPSYGLPSVPSGRAVSGPQGRSMYTGFPQPDYSAYYGNVDYGFYGNPATPGHTHSSSVGRMYSGVPTHTPSQSADYGQQAAYGYDYGARAAQGNQYYYPVYPNISSPMSPMAPAAAPATMADKKRDMQVGLIFAWVMFVTKKYHVVRCHSTTAAEFTECHVSHLTVDTIAPVCW